MTGVQTCALPICQHPDAQKFETLSFEEALQRQLRVMDLTAFTLCMERTMDVVVFNIWEPGSLRRIALGEPIGTTVRRAKLKEV